METEALAVASRVVASVMAGSNAHVEQVGWAAARLGWAAARLHSSWGRG
jgi:hypothetical protein